MNLKEVVIKKWKWILLAIVLVCFIAIAEDVFEKEIMKVDIIAYNIIVENLRVGWLTKTMSIITNFGGTYILPIICILALIITKKRRIGLAMCCNLAIISASNILLKNIVQRPRPDGYRLISETGYSFPSGHSMISTAFYGLIIYFIYKYVKNKKVKYLLCILLSALIVIIGFSRIYLGVHYASDVIAGFLVSIAYLICFITVYNSIEQKLKDKN